MVFAVVLVVLRRASHFTLDDDDKLVANPEFLGPCDEIVDAGQKLGDQLHLVDVVVGVTVELADVEIRRNADTGLERCECNLGLTGESFFGRRPWNKRRDTLERLRVQLCGVEHTLGTLDSRQANLGNARPHLFFQSPFDPVGDEIIVVASPGAPINTVGIGNADSTN